MATLEQLEQILIDIRDMVNKLPNSMLLPPRSIRLKYLSDFTNNLGLITAGEFRAGNEREPGDGFSGVRMSYPPVIYGAKEWNIVGVESDTMQFGISASDGNLCAGGGGVVLNSDGIVIKDSNEWGGGKIAFSNNADESLAFIDCFVYGELNTNSLRIMSLASSDPSYRDGMITLQVEHNSDAGWTTLHIKKNGISINHPLSIGSTSASDAPIITSLATVVTNLNADMLDGNHSSDFALFATGVTNGNSHDHSGGDGAQINHKALSNIGTTTHADIDTYIQDNGKITWLTTPLTSTSWDGDARSTTTATKIDMSSVFSGYPKDKVKAVLVRLACRDSATLGTTGLSIGIGPSATYYNNVSTIAIGGDVVSSQTAWCSCDANGDIYFRVVASGTNTLDAWLEVWGYIV